MKKALVTTIVLVLGLGLATFAANPLSGSWKTDIEITIDGAGGLTVTDFDSTLSVDYTISGWTFGSVTGFELGGWTTQSFSADGVLGAFTFGSALVFDPANAAFTSWDTTVSVSIAGITFDAEFLLMGGADWGSGWTLGASGIAGDVTLATTVYFNMDSAGNLVQTGDCCVCFTGIDIEIGLPWCCIETVDIDLSFGCETGFEGVCFSVSGIAIPAWPWLSFDAELCFYTGETGKLLTLTPVLDLGDFSCITLYYALLYEGGVSCQTAPTVITGVEFYGIGLTCTIGGCTFTSLSSFNEADYDLVKDPYWEVFTIACDADGCCGGLFSFQIDTYFDCTSAMLFDWGETDVTMSFGLGSNLTLSVGLVVDTIGFTEWTLGFEFAF